VLIGHREGLAELLDSEYRLFKIPNEILPITLQKGRNLLITVELDKAKKKQFQSDLINEQARLLLEEEDEADPTA